MDSEQLLELEHKAEKTDDKLLKVDRLNHFAYESRNINPKRSESAAERALELATELNYAKGRAESLSNLGFYNVQLSKHELSFQQLLECLDIYQKLEDEKGIGNAFYNLGILHLRVGNLNDSIEMLHKCLAIKEKLHDKGGQAACHFQLSFVNHQYYNDIDTAFDAANRSLSLRREINDVDGVAAALMSLGDIYIKKKDFVKAKEVLEESLRMRILSGEPLGYYGTQCRLAELMLASGELDEAKKLCTEGLNAASERKIFFGVIRFLQVLGKTEMKLNNTEAALEAYTKALKHAHELSFRSIEYELHEALTEIYKLTGDYKAALDNFQKFHALKEEVVSLQSNTRLKSAQFMVQIESAKREAEIEKLKNEELKKAHDIIEEKNKDITDSIRYARRIQTSILPKDSFIESMFPQSFVLYKPKDIVSGDFYWATLKEGKRIIVAADCTGHGVPGAFMSMTGSTLLNEIVNEKGITCAADILNHLRERLMQTLQQTGADGESKDGMDITLCVIDGNKMEFAGANNPLYLIRNGTLQEFKGDKQPIGVHVGEQRPFIQNTIELHKGDHLYLFTDGYADQFGGPKGKKFKYKQLQEELLDSTNLSMDRQKKKLEEVLEKWRGTLEQVDDILVLGIRV